MSGDQRAEARIPHSPLPPGRALRSPLTQSLSLGVHPATQMSYAGVPTLCQSCGRTDQLGPATLPEAFPGLIAPIALTDQATRPVANELHNRCLGAVGVELNVSHGRMGHAPQPRPSTVQEPR